MKLKIKKLILPILIFTLFKNISADFLQDIIELDQNFKNIEQNFKILKQKYTPDLKAESSLPSTLKDSLNTYISEYKKGTKKFTEIAQPQIINKLPSAIQKCIVDYSSTISRQIIDMHNEIQEMYGKFLS